MKVYLQNIAVVFLYALLCTAARAQTNQPVSRELKVFKELLAGIDASFVFPDGFNELKPPPNTDRSAYQYALELPDGDFEMKFKVNQTKTEWQNHERAKSGQEKGMVNPDSLYSKIALSQITEMAVGSYTARSIPRAVLQRYNADIGRSYFITLSDQPAVKHYQYALLVILQKNHYGDISVVCYGNDSGPEFFKKVNKARDCLKFNN